MEYNNQVSEIKDRLDIVQVIGRYVQLKQTGKNFSGLCPFHKEKTPSFMVSPDLQRYKCFGCGESGDIFNFIQKIENLDFPETLEKLAKEAGVELKKFEPNPKYKILEEINYTATKYYYRQLALSEEASQYLQKRGLTKETIKNFGIGFAPRYPHLLNELNSKKKYTKEELLQSGLFTEKNGVIKEKFYNRIMFPIRSKKGDVIGFTARIMPGDDKGPKYMNTPETPIFHKKDNLFGQYESKQEIRKLDSAIVCEGSMDVISSHQHGFKNIVAPLGTSLTIEQLKLLSTLTKNIIFFFDNDDAGKMALIRAFKLASEIGINPYAATSSPYKDIDEMLQSGSQKMEEALSNKQEAFSIILFNTIGGKDLNKLEDINKIRAVIEPLLESVKDTSTKALYISKYTKITKIRYNSVKPIDIRETKTHKQITKSLQTEKYKTPEFLYLQMLIFYDDDIPKELIIDSIFFRDTPYEQIYKSLLEQINNFDKEKFFKQFDNEEQLHTLVENLIFQAREIPNTTEERDSQLKDLIKKIKIGYYTNLQKNISSQIAMTEEIGDTLKQAELLKQLEHTAKIINKLKND